MPTLYLIDAHNNVLNSSKINDTVNLAEGYTETRSLRGSFPIVLPYDVPLDGLPADLGDLVTKKYVGMLALYPGYQNILFDEQTDAAGWSVTTTEGGIYLGLRQTNALYNLSNAQNFIVSTASTLTYAPTVACVRWEVFEYLYNDLTGDTATRYFREATPTAFAVSVSFNGGSTYVSVTHGMMFQIPPADQGTSFRIKFDRFGAGSSTPVKANLGSWALIY